jgi:hypothetical protein
MKTLAKLRVWFCPNRAKLEQQVEDLQDKIATWNFLDTREAEAWRRGEKMMKARIKELEGPLVNHNAELDRLRDVEVLKERIEKLEEELADAEMANVEAAKLIAIRNRELELLEEITLERAAKIADAVHRENEYQYGRNPAKAIRKEIT